MTPWLVAAVLGLIGTVAALWYRSKAQRTARDLAALRTEHVELADEHDRQEGVLHDTEQSLQREVARQAARARRDAGSAGDFLVERLRDAAQSDPPAE